MILSILGMLLSSLPDFLVDYTVKKAEGQNENLRIRAQDEQQRRTTQRDVLIKEADHWIAWVPRFMISFAVALYVLAIFLVSIFQIPWTVLQVPAAMEEVVWIVISALFLEKVTRIAKR